MKRWVREGEGCGRDGLRRPVFQKSECPQSPKAHRMTATKSALLLYSQSSSSAHSVVTPATTNTPPSVCSSQFPPSRDTPSRSSATSDYWR